MTAEALLLVLLATIAAWWVGAAAYHAAGERWGEAAYCAGAAVLFAVVAGCCR